eukprot:3037531-Pleurochrysis_carterae.AAC.1
MSKKFHGRALTRLNPSFEYAGCDENEIAEFLLFASRCWGGDGCANSRLVRQCGEDSGGRRAE